MGASSFVWLSTQFILSSLYIHTLVTKDGDDEYEPIRTQYPTRELQKIMEIKNTS